MFCKEDEKFVFIMTSAMGTRVIARKIDVIKELIGNPEVEFNVKTLLVYKDCKALYHIVREFRHGGLTPYQEEEWLDSSGPAIATYDAHRVSINRYIL